jgi:hypothetical protein
MREDPFRAKTRRHAETKQSSAFLLATTSQNSPFVTLSDLKMISTAEKTSLRRAMLSFVQSTAFIGRPDESMTHRDVYLGDPEDPSFELVGKDWAGNFPAQLGPAWPSHKAGESITHWGVYSEIVYRAMSVSGNAAALLT